MSTPLACHCDPSPPPSRHPRKRKQADGRRDEEGVSESRPRCRHRKRRWIVHRMRRQSPPRATGTSAAMAVEGVPGSLPRSQPRSLRRWSESSRGSAPQAPLDRSLRAPIVSTASARNRGHTLSSLDAPPWSPPGRPTRLLGHCRNACCDGSPRVPGSLVRSQPRPLPRCSQRLLCFVTARTAGSFTGCGASRHRGRDGGHSLPSPDAPPWSPPGKVRLLSSGRYRNVCRDGSGRGAQFAPSTATLATRRAVGKDSPVRYRMRRRRLTAIVRRSPPRRCTWHSVCLPDAPPRSPQGRATRLFGRPQRPTAMALDLAARLSPAAARLGFSESRLEYHLGLSRQLPLRVSIAIPPHDEGLLRGHLRAILECITLSFPKSWRKSLRINLLRINIFIHRPITRDSQTRSETEGKIKARGHVGSKF
jgi:hypothetical protein